MNRVTAMLLRLWLFAVFVFAPRIWPGYFNTYIRDDLPVLTQVVLILLVVGLLETWALLTFPAIRKSK